MAALLFACLLVFVLLVKASSNICLRSFVVTSFFFFLKDVIACSPGWPKTACRTEDDLEFRILLPKNYTYAPS